MSLALPLSRGYPVFFQKHGKLGKPRLVLVLDIVVLLVASDEGFNLREFTQRTANQQDEHKQVKDATVQVLEPSQKHVMHVVW